MGRLLKIKEAADYLGVSIDTLRNWDKTKKLTPIKTPGKHRRYDIDELNEFLGVGELYKYKEYYMKLISAEYLADELNDKWAEDIKRIRLNVAATLCLEYHIADDTIGFNKEKVIEKRTKKKE